ncbi:class I SAM-dependent methyltransferase [Marinactinospora thermotolerans]|uniref:class I SAM-dependent methyltransferase n=1 Tax=Marinactinospora thermotolerans TaxID=531310 RepID=UPI003D92C015
MAAGYDRGAGLERRFLGDSRGLLCGLARGRTLEIAVGTGRNLDRYPDGVEVTGLDLSPGMLARAARAAAGAGRRVDLREGDARRLPFPDASFDSVVCTLALCEIPDQATAVDEMYRVLRPGGALLLLDHVEYARMPLRLFERRRAARRGRPPRRRPVEVAVERGFAVERHDRLVLGFFDRVVARRPA